MGNCTALIKEGKKAVVELKRVEIHNALNTETLKELRDTVEELNTDKSIQVVIITGSGKKAFSAGADLKEIRDLNEREAIQFAQLGHSIMDGITKMQDKTTIAAVNGIALGGGLELALSCDLRIASDNAIFGFPEVKLGLIPGFGGTQRLSRLIGRSSALEMILTGDHIDAVKARERGLINSIHAPENLMVHAHTLADKILAVAPNARRRALNLIKTGYDMTLAVALEEEAEIFAEILCGDEAKIGIKAFIEHTKPAYFPDDLIPLEQSDEE